ncbi:MAG: diguanylate cyclase [Lachnospiraceae bacterium]|nr:diguanylate cyclase [Lachnospiraceae bacterium]
MQFSGKNRLSLISEENKDRVSLWPKLTGIICGTAAVVALLSLLVLAAMVFYLDRTESDRALELMGIESATSIDMELSSVRDAVDSVYYYAYDQLGSLFGKLYGSEFRSSYLDRVSTMALTSALSSDFHIETVYYCLTTEIKDDPKGFLYLRDSSTGLYTQFPLTDLDQYSKDDIGHTGWYYEPLRAKEPVWIGPYHNENLDIDVISYVVPVMVYGRFAGVIGMDINVEGLSEKLSSITVYRSGCAVLVDKTDHILYHRSYDERTRGHELSSDHEDLIRAMKESLQSGKTQSYRGNGTAMKLYARTLDNGMTLCVTAPHSELYATGSKILLLSVLAVLIILSAAVTWVLFALKRVYLPIRELADISERLVDGDMNARTTFHSEDETGRTAKAMDLMAVSLKSYFAHFHNMAYTDALTGLNNKEAFLTTKEVIESEMRLGRAGFALIVMDVNGLRKINVTLGHERGDELLKQVTKCLRETFIGFPLYRIGGDEFVSVINNKDPEELISRLQSITLRRSRETLPVFGTMFHIAAGAAVYQKGKDREFDDVYRRAEKAMMDHKSYLKEKEAQEDDSGTSSSSSI